MTHHEAGRKCVLLYVGDHDPAGLLMSDVIKSNLMDCANVKGVDFDPSPIRVERIGLTREQIDDLGLPWIENLETGSGKDLGDPGHPDHRKPYVQNYIASQGRRKVEANALVRDLRGSRGWSRRRSTATSRQAGPLSTKRGWLRIDRLPAMRSRR